MQEENWKEFIKNAKEAYYKIGSVPCRAFNGELVYFNRYGWNHLFRKGRKVRDTEEQRERVNLLKYAEYILRMSVEIFEYRENEVDENRAYFWSIKRYVNGVCIRIVVRQLNTSKKHFFSIMEEENEKIL